MPVIKYDSQISGPRIQYRKIPKISPGAYIFQRSFLRGLVLEGLISKEGNLRFKMDWASLIVGKKWTVFALLYFVFEGNFQVQAPGGLLNPVYYLPQNTLQNFLSILHKGLVI